MLMQLYSIDTLIGTTIQFTAEHTLVRGKPILNFFLTVKLVWPSHFQGQTSSLSTGGLKELIMGPDWI